jgi:hypothetical protein
MHIAEMLQRWHCFTGIMTPKWRNLEASVEEQADVMKGNVCIQTSEF